MWFEVIGGCRLSQVTAAGQQCPPPFSLLLIFLNFFSNCCCGGFSFVKWQEPNRPKRSSGIEKIKNTKNLLSLFLKKVNLLKSDRRNRRWLFVPYDQLSDQIGPLARENLRDLGIIVVESSWKVEKESTHGVGAGLIAQTNHSAAPARSSGFQKSA